MIMFPAFFLAKLPAPEITQAGCMHTLIGTSFSAGKPEFWLSGMQKNEKSPLNPDRDP